MSKSAGPRPGRQDLDANTVSSPDGPGHGRRGGRAGQQDTDLNTLSNYQDGSRGGPDQAGQTGQQDADLKPVYKSEGQRAGRRAGHPDADLNIV